MTTFHELLLSRFELGGFSTEDALASFLPLARQAAATHAAGKVAPLEGVAALQVEGVRLWYPEASASEPAGNPTKLRMLDKPLGGVEILSSRRRTIDVDAGAGEYGNLDIGKRDEEIIRPVYLPGYISWEHQVGHHDPVTDIFSLGLILASLGCSLDLNHTDDLQSFVTNRRNLFRLRPQLHPVVAKAIVSMTELSRRQRLQDLTTLIDNLENYRDQSVDITFDLATAEDVGGDRKKLILGRLQERLFEVSRRNRLLHFHAAIGCVNLTHASVPLSFDVMNIRPEQILTWSGDFAKKVSAAEPVSLNHHLNFAEQIYLPSVLDRLRTEASRDAAEYGFEQLRLALCFLRWANVKANPPEQYDSPLVLLPVKLVKKKGVRDAYFLQPLTTEAELNPVVRHLFQQLYGIDLPGTIDLEETTLDKFHDDLAARVTASEPGITVKKVDRPRIDLIHEMARRRLDRYRRSTRLSGRGIKSFHNVDYSYSSANFHPLGLALFNARIRPNPTQLRQIVQRSPTPRHYIVPPQEEDIPISGKQRQFYALRELADDNPFHWEFDLCRLTLGNFHYRKMTLVRDYADLAKNGIENPAFDAIFSPIPRPVETEAPPSPPLEDRFHIVPCDPTQATAIGLARAGASYIIQGPPGTGKSQTITNLIADYVMRGKKVLFVCEKRAAIDVVYSRLKQQGLHQLCCLIYDSQRDKKEFIADLKSTYESLATEQQPDLISGRRRLDLIQSLREELKPLEAFNKSMLSIHPRAGLTVRELLERAIELSRFAGGITADQQYALPDYAQWQANIDTIGHLSSALSDLGGDGVLARHPLRQLNPKIALQERPAEFVANGLRSAQEFLLTLTSILKTADIQPRHYETLNDVIAITQYARHLEPLARRNLVALLNEKSDLSTRFTQGTHVLAGLQTALSQAADAAKNWRDRLPAAEVALALEQAQSFEGRPLSAIKPAWWRMRKVLRRRYNFSAHAIRPSWTQVLTVLDHEYKAAAAFNAAQGALSAELGVTDSPAAIALEVGRAREATTRLTPTVESLQASIFASDRASAVVLQILQAAQPANQLVSVCADFLEDIGDRPLETLRMDLERIESSLASIPDFLYCLEQLGQLPCQLAAVFRNLPIDASGMEAAIAARTIDDIFRSDRILHRFTGSVRDGHVQRLAGLSRKWREINAAAVLEIARRGFLERLKLSARPAQGLTPEQKDLKAAYSRGRRALEHEFGKVMRHKSIRDLVAGDSGLVIGDLKPVWLMSPLSVCDTLPLRVDQFDVVIFDEASQIPLEEAVPAIFRSTQTIVVGDEMQLPPTDFFSARADGLDEEGLRIGDAGGTYEYDLSSNSFLNHAAKNLASRMLGWHYRSRSESLISFSNWAFYNGKLLTVPERQTTVAARPEIIADVPADGELRAADLLARPVSFHFMAHGIYDGRRNAVEADYIAHLVRGLLAEEDHLSIGIVAFSEAQQSQIESALSRLADEDKAFGLKLEAEFERQIDGQFAGLLIKNLENIQGDERDIVILSVCYGYAPDGKMRMNFGPINQSGGEKRLNVAFSRAKHHMAVISSIRPAAISNEYNDGANCLKNYLQYATACSIGDLGDSQRILRGLAIISDDAKQDSISVSIVVTQIAAAIRERGYVVDIDVGMSHFRCDVAVRRHGESGYRIGLLVDTSLHYQQTDILERELLRPELLNAFGWRIAHVLTRDWHFDRQAVLDRLLILIENGHDADGHDAAKQEKEPENM